MHFLRNPIHLRQISVILAKDENTADLLYGCLKELGLHVKVLSLDGLAKLDEAHLKDRMNELFGTGSSNSFACNFQKYVKQLQWNGAGELPLFVGSFKRSDGLVPNEPMPENSLLALPKGLQLLLQQKRVGIFHHNPVKVEKKTFWRYSASANCVPYFLTMFVPPESALGKYCLLTIRND